MEQKTIDGNLITKKYRYKNGIKYRFVNDGKYHKYICTKCKRKKNSQTVVSYFKGDIKKIICKECFWSIPEKPKFIRNNSEEELSEFLPRGTEIFVGNIYKHNCEGNPDAIILSHKEILSTHGLKLPVELKECTKCGKLYVTEANYYSVKNISSKYRFIEENVVRNIESKDFTTRVKLYGCSNKEHRLKDVRCMIKVISRVGVISTVEMVAAYCPVCNRYYVLEAEYQRLKQMGILVCKVVENDYWISGKHINEYYSLNQESLLHMLGYNVNSRDELPQAQRWRILEIVVDDEILTRAEIMSHLQWLIRRSGNSLKYSDARTKWEADYVHISQYGGKIEMVPVVEAASIVRNNYRHRE